MGKNLNPFVQLKSKKTNNNNKNKQTNRMLKSKFSTVMEGNYTSKFL